MMSFKCPPEIAEATRLTSAGKIAEATALIQRRLKGPAAANHAGPAKLCDGGVAMSDTAASRSAGPFDLPHTGRRTGLGATLRSLAASVGQAGLAGEVRGRARPAPDPLPDGASFEQRTYENAAGMRAYKLYVPGSRVDRPLPLVVMLHGCTQSPDDFAAGTRMNLIAEERGFFVAYPAQSAADNAQKCWNWFSPGDQRRGGREPSLIAGITRQIMREHPVDAQRVYIAGLSAGGAATAIMGAAYPELYAAIGVHSGLPCAAARDLPSALAAMREGAAGGGRCASLVPTILFHGDRDTTVHPRNGDAVAAQATRSSPGLRSMVQRGEAPGGHAYSRTVHVDPSGLVLCEQWTIHGAGHAWAGGSPSGSYTDPRGPDASREMLRFFFEHARGETQQV